METITTEVEEEEKVVQTVITSVTKFKGESQREYTLRVEEYRRELCDINNKFCKSLNKKIIPFAEDQLYHNRIRSFLGSMRNTNCMENIDLYLKNRSKISGGSAIFIKRKKDIEKLNRNINLRPAKN